MDDGKLRLDDPPAKILPESSRVHVKQQTKAPGVPITIRQLTTHASGIAADRPPELENITRTFDHPGLEFGLFSTAEDLRHFCQMMLNRASWHGRTVLSPKLVDEMIRSEMPTSAAKYYSGLGRMVRSSQRRGKR